MKSTKRLVSLLLLLLLLSVAASGCVPVAVRGALRVTGAHTTVKAEAATNEDAYDLYLRGLIFLSGDDVTLTVKPRDGPARVEVDCAKALVSKYGLAATIEGGEIRIRGRRALHPAHGFLPLTVYAPCKSVYSRGRV
jgi:hypothetical protein